MDSSSPTSSQLYYADSNLHWPFEIKDYTLRETFHFSNVLPSVKNKITAKNVAEIL